MLSKTVSAQKYSKSFKGSLSETKEGKSGQEVTFKEKGSKYSLCYILLAYMDSLISIIDKVYTVAQGKQVSSPDVTVIDKLSTIEIKLAELLEIRNKLISYGDYNLQKELKELENTNDRNRKNVKLQKKRDEEQQEKIDRQLKSAKRIENQQKIQVYILLLYI